MGVSGSNLGGATQVDKLKAGRDVRFYIKAGNVAGASPVSAVATFATAPAPPK